MDALPSFLRRYFWDTDFAQVDPEANAPAIIGRILEQGDPEAVAWLKQHYTRSQLADVLYRYRFVSPKSANYWAVVLNLSREKILCLQKHYLETQRRHWPY